MLADVLNVELKQTRFYQDIFKEGKAEGKMEGERKILRHMLIKRFGALPDWAEKGMAEASSRQLENWSERLLDAGNLDEVFGRFKRYGDDEES